MSSADFLRFCGAAALAAASMALVACDAEALGLEEIGKPPFAAAR